MFRYQKVKGEENRIFADKRNLENGIVESDTLIDSPYLTLIEDKPATPPVSPQNPPQNMPVNQATPLQSEQTTNKERLANV